MRKIIFSIIIFLFLINTNAHSKDKMRIAVLDLTAKGVSKIVANAATNIIRSEFVNIANFTVVERAAIDEILKEQGFQMAGCTDESCAVEVGKLLSAQKIIVGEINKLGESVVITLRIIDVEKGQSEYSAREKASSLDSVDEAAIRIARKLTQRIVSGEKEFFTPQTRFGYYSRSIVPGWGQIYAGHEKKGVAFAGLFLLSGLVFYFQYNNFQDKQNAYNYEPLGSENFDQRRSDLEKAELYANISLGLVGAVYLIHWIDVIFFSSPEFGTKKTTSVEQKDDFRVNLYSRPVKGFHFEEIIMGLEIKTRF